MRKIYGLFNADDVLLYTEFMTFEEIIEDIIDVIGEEIIDYPEMTRFKELDWSNIADVNYMAEVLEKAFEEEIFVDEIKYDEFPKEMQ